MSTRPGRPIGYENESNSAHLPISAFDKTVQDTMPAAKLFPTTAHGSQSRARSVDVEDQPKHFSKLQKGRCPDVASHRSDPIDGYGPDVLTLSRRV